MNQFIIPKDDPNIPSYYSIEIEYYDGKKEPKDIISYGLGEGLLSFWTKDEEYQIRILDKIRAINFDKKYSTLCSLQEELRKKQKAGG